MAIKSSYLIKTLEGVKKLNTNEPEFIQAVTEVFESIEPVIDKNPIYEKNAILEKLVEPDRVIKFKVPWVDDLGKTHINRGFRIQFSNVIGPYKGGLRFHPSVYEGTLKFLAFEQIFKNSLTGLPLGGGKGGSDFDPKGRTDNEIKSFCQSFMNELYKYIGANVDIPAGDIGVGGREIGYLFGQYKRITGSFEGVLTGKGIPFGGSLVRTEATGYGLCYFAERMLNEEGKTFNESRVIISGSGNVATYAAKKAISMGAKVISMSDSNGYIYDEAGINIDTVIKLKAVERKRIKEYLNIYSNAKYFEDCSNIWSIPCDIAMPCATQNELNEESAKLLIQNGCFAVAEGANMPSTTEAIKIFQANNILFAPAKASNAGGVATSGLEMSQNSMRYSWTFEEVDCKLKNIMNGIYENISTTATNYGMSGNLVAGANIAGFIKVADAMIAQG